MSGCPKLVGLLTFANIVGRLLCCEAPPVQPADRISGAVCTAETEVTHAGGYLALARFADVERRSSLEGSFFTNVLREHDAFLPEMARWRQRLATHAAGLARLVKTFPGAAHLSEDRVREVIGSDTGLPAGAPEDDVFRPWASRWSGQWSDGSLQYHVWDRSRCQEGRWVQRVAQSEAAFPEPTRLGSMVHRGEVDLAVNVFSERLGITGWVSKRQHGPLDIPCIGYLLEPAVLLWICQTSGRAREVPGQGALVQDGWFAYLESVEASSDSATYHIYGHAFTLTSRGLRYGAPTALHTSQYQSR